MMRTLLLLGLFFLASSRSLASCLPEPCSQVVIKVVQCSPIRTDDSWFPDFSQPEAQRLRMRVEASGVMVRAEVLSKRQVQCFPDDKDSATTPWAYPTSTSEQRFFYRGTVSTICAELKQ